MSNIKGTSINLELKKFNFNLKKLLNLNFDYARSYSYYNNGFNI